MKYFVRRLWSAVQVLRGKTRIEQLLESVAELTDSLREAERIEHVLREVIEKTQREREYWYAIWFRESRAYQAGQHALMGEIDKLRRKYEVKNADKLSELEQLAAKQLDEQFVHVKNHPSPAVKTELEHVDAPPKKWDGKFP